MAPSSQRVSTLRLPDSVVKVHLGGGAGVGASPKPHSPDRAQSYSPFPRMPAPACRGEGGRGVRSAQPQTPHAVRTSSLTQQSVSFPYGSFGGLSILG